VDSEAVVEERNGVLTVNSAAPAGVQEIVLNGGLFIPAGAANVEEDTLELTTYVGAYYVEANGRVLYVEDGVILVDGKVALPVRVLAKIFNMDVAYDAESKKVALTRQKEGGAYLEDGETYYDEDMLYWMSRIIYSESGNQPLRGKIAVGNVVLNRMADPSFPDTIYGVLFQKNQFSPAMSGSIYRTPNAASVKAAKMVLDGAEALENVLFFNRKGMNTRASRNRPFVATIGGHSFYA
jgi:N-acetylmuramoyl-L-alanine amidase